MPVRVIPTYLAAPPDRDPEMVFDIHRDAVRIAVDEPQVDVPRTDRAAPRVVLPHVDRLADGVDVEHPAAVG
jgi:hypothetical protein